MYINYKGQYSRLNQSILFGHHKDWIDGTDSMFNKGYSFDYLLSKKVDQFRSVTFKPGYRIIRVDPNTTPYIKGGFLRDKFMEYYKCTLAKNRDVVPDKDTIMTIFAQELFLGRKVQRILAYDEYAITVEFDKRSYFEISKEKVVELEAFKKIQ